MTRIISMLGIVMAVMLILGPITASAAPSRGQAGHQGGSIKAEKPDLSGNVTRGEIVTLTLGKNVQIKEPDGRMRTFYFSKKTVISGDLKVGEQVSVTSAGRWAQEVTVKSALATR